jgi:hypothetical protein
MLGVSTERLSHGSLALYEAFHTPNAEAKVVLAILSDRRILPSEAET